MRMSKQEELAHTLLQEILKRYPVIEEMETNEDRYRAIIRLQLGGFKRKDGSTIYSFPNPYKEVDYELETR